MVYLGAYKSSIIGNRMCDITTEGAGFRTPPMNSGGQDCPLSVTPSAEDVFGEEASCLFLDPVTAVDIHEGNLPHWQQGNVIYFVTWHTADALPSAKRAELREEKRLWIARHPQPWDETTRQEYHTLFTPKLQEWLDAGNGACVLRKPELADIVGNALLHFDGTRCHIAAYVVMPNHVHVLFRLLGGERIEKLVKSWKGYTANAINRCLARSGVFWQDEYWDCIIRNDTHFARCWEYIRMNPILANLSEGQFAYYAAVPNNRSVNE